MIQVAAITGVARGAWAIELIMTRRQNHLPMNERNSMTSNKELLAPKEMTTGEIKSLVDEWLERGGKVTQCAPNVALNFRSQGDVIHPPRPHRLAVAKAKSAKAAEAKEKKKKKKKK